MSSAGRVELVDFVGHTFACSVDVAERICRRLRDRRYPVRTVVIKQGDRSEFTFLLITGRAEALSYGPEGRVVLLQEFHSGDLFGAVMPSESEGEMADVVAVDDLRTAVFAARDFLSLIEAHNCVGLLVSRMLLRQLRATTLRMVEQTTLSAVGRIHAELLRLARLGDGHSISPLPNFSILAVHVRSTRETVSRTIHALERRGLVRRDADALVITAPQRLEEMII